MGPLKLLMSILLVSIPLCAGAGEQAPGRAPTPGTPDARYPVQLTPEEAVRQKGEMRNNLVALRRTLAALADKDFVGVEDSVRRLAHEGPLTARPGASTSIFRDLERGFERSVDKTLEAARSRDSDAVLRALGDTLAYCQSCHMAFRQAVEPKPEGKPETKPAEAPPKAP